MCSKSVLGVGGSTHDHAFYLIDESGAHVALENERLSRVKHSTDGFSDISLITVKGLIERDRPGLLVRNSALVARTGEIDTLADEVVVIGHHFAHACWAYYTSGRKDAVVIVVDGCGSVLEHGSESHTREVTSIWGGDGKELSLLKMHDGIRAEPHTQNTISLLTSNSIGDFYAAVTKVLGFGEFGAGKTMALAGIGAPRFQHHVQELATPQADGQIRVDFSRPGHFEAQLASICDLEAGNLQSKADLAASAQAVFEEAMFSLVEYAYSLKRSPTLCFSGGCALNVAFNGKLVSNSPFSDIHIVNAPGDSGTAGGAALWGKKLLGEANLSKFNTVSLGLVRDELEDDELRDRGLVVQNEGPEAMLDLVECLTDGEIVAWHLGRSEYGPRALGNRSIICLPNVKGAKAYINGEVKKRAQFQPFGMSLLKVATLDVFGCSVNSPYMEKAMPVLDKFREQLSEVIHADGTIRFQTVVRGDPFYGLLRALSDLGRVPAILNTSLNGQDEPICETQQDTIRFFEASPLRFLYLNGRLVRKIRS